MSHPWAPQPYYGYQQARLSAPVPAPMGLGSYSVGSFGPKQPWATPKYVADMASGLHGGGLGADTDCVNPQAVAQLLVSAVKVVGGRYKVDVPILGTMSLGNAVGAFESLIARGINELTTTMNQGSTAAKKFVYKTFKSALGSPVGDVAHQLGVLQKAVDEIWNQSGLSSLRLCATWKPAAVEVSVASPYLSEREKALKAQIQAQVQAGYTGSRAAFEQRDTNFRAVFPKGTTPGAGGAAGGNTTMLLGAAALAALFLLR